MKNFFKMCIVLLALSGNMYSQTWLWSKSQGVSSTMPLKGNTRLAGSGNLVTFFDDNGSSHLVYTSADGDVTWNNLYPDMVIKDIYIDGADNIYFCGNFKNSITISGNTFVSQGGNDAIIGMFNSSGVLLKYKTFGTALDESATSIALKNNVVYLTGSFIQSQMVNTVSLTGNGTKPNTFVLKLDMNFNAQAGIESVSDGSAGVKIAVDNSNNVYVLGTSEYTISVGTQSVYIAEDGEYLLKLDNNLGVTWLKYVVDHYMNGYHRPFIYFDNSSNIILALVTGGGGGSDHALSIQKYDPSGNSLWQQGSGVNVGMFVDTDAADNIWISGGYAHFNGDYDFVVSRISSSGAPAVYVVNDTTVLHRVLGFALKANNDFYIDYLCQTPSSLGGYACSPSNSVFMTRYASPASGIEKLTLKGAFNIYPNPFSGTFIVKANSEIADCSLCIKNTLGQTVYTNSIGNIKGNFSKEIDISSQPKGIYFVELRSGEDKMVEKIVLQ